MEQCLAEFQRNGVPKELEQLTWSQVESIVRDSILVVPPPRATPTPKKHVTVAGRLLARKLLEEIAAANAQKKHQRQRRSQ
jgi:hypothetical protein